MMYKKKSILSIFIVIVPIFLSSCTSGVGTSHTAKKVNVLKEEKIIIPHEAADISDLFLSCAAIMTRNSSKDFSFASGRVNNFKTDSPVRGIESLLLSAIYRAANFNPKITYTFYSSNLKDLLTLQGAHPNSTFSPPNLYLTGGVTEMIEDIDPFQFGTGSSADGSTLSGSYSNSTGRVSIDLHGINIASLKMIPTAYSSISIDYKISSGGSFSAGFSLFGVGISSRISTKDVEPGDTVIRTGINFSIGMLLLRYAEIDPTICTEHILNINTSAKIGAIKIGRLLISQGIDKSFFSCPSYNFEMGQWLLIDYIENCEPSIDARLAIGKIINGIGRIWNGQISRTDLALIDLLVEDNNATDS